MTQLPVSMKRSASDGRGRVTLFSILNISLFFSLGRRIVRFRIFFACEGSLKGIGQKLAIRFFFGQKRYR